jgi:hypothetical protein
MRSSPIQGVAVLLLAAVPGFAQEFDPHDPAVIAERLDRASTVIVGTFKVDRCLPWFDGWHCSGEVHVAESIHGDWKPSQTVPFRWKERFGNICLVCEKVSQFDGQNGIWFLTKKNDVWAFTPTGAFWCGGPFPLDDRDAVIRLVRQRNGK